VKVSQKIRSLSDERLVHIENELTRLAAEYGRKETSGERREEIILRIKELRAERAQIMQ
jgi:hypothetical protein